MILRMEFKYSNSSGQRRCRYFQLNFVQVSKDIDTGNLGYKIWAHTLIKVPEIKVIIMCQKKVTLIYVILN